MTRWSNDRRFFTRVWADRRDGETDQDVADRHSRLDTGYTYEVTS